MLTYLENAWREKSHNEGKFIAGLLNPDASEMSKQRLSLGCLDHTWSVNPWTTRESQGGLMEWWEFHPTVLIVSCVVAQEKKRQHCWKIVSAVDAGENWVLWKKISLAFPRPHHPLSAWHRPTEQFASSWKARNKCFLQTPNSPAAAHLVALRVVSWLLRIRWS